MSSTATSPNFKLLKAQYIWRAAGPLQREAAVLIQGDRVLKVDTSTSLQRDHPDAQVFDFGAAIILPGLVNAHTHLELSNCTSGSPPKSFIDWLLSMPRRVARETDESADNRFAAATEVGVEQSLRFGITCVGDISQQCHITRPIIARSPIRAISYGEVIGLGRRRERFDELLSMALDASERTDRLRIGLSPHSPFTVEGRRIHLCLEIARERSLPLATHLAETSYERAYLQSVSGPLREMWESLGQWTKEVEADFIFTAGPIHFGQLLGLLDYPSLLAHVNYCNDEELAILSQGRASVVYCPRTHRYFGHPPHRWREMLAAGINVAIGTDSCASSPDLNLVDDLRLLHEIAPEMPVETLWRVATVNGAKALQWHEELQNIADFTIFDAKTDDPLTEILETTALPREVWIAGERVPGAM